jgi:mevalonate kinase
MNRPPTTERTTTGSAPTRVCLGGEDLDWIGGPALQTAIELRVSVTFRRQPSSPMLTIRSHGALPAFLALPSEHWLDPTTSELELTRLCWQYAAQGHAALSGGDLSIQSVAPSSAGLASSATTCVAALRALTPSPTGGVVPAAHLVHAAYHVERDMAGRPVGPMDFVPAAFGGTTLVRSEAERITDITHLPLPQHARFLVVDTRTPRDTGAVVAWKRDRFARQERGIRYYAQRMTELVDEQARLLDQRADLETLGQTLDEAQALLAHLMNVSTPLIDTCAARLRANGALGVKLTGTGLGGCLFALTTTETDTNQLTTCLHDLPVGMHLVRPAPAEPTEPGRGLRTLRTETSGTDGDVQPVV